MTRTITSLFAALALLGVACAQNGTGDGGGEAAPAPVPPPEVSFTIADQGVTEVPEQVQAGINTVTVTNEGKEKHFLAMVRVDDGVAKQKVGLALAKQDFETFFTSAHVAGALLDETGKVNVPTGGTGTLTVELTEGTYLLTDPEAKRFEPGYFEVGPAGDAEIQAPVSEYDVSEKEYAIDFPATVSAGAHTFALTNAGEQGHELIIMNKENPDKESGYAMAPVPGSTEWITFDLKPGKYLVACYFPDVRDGKMQKKNHSQLGMKATFTVK